MSRHQGICIPPRGRVVIIDLADDAGERISMLREIVGGDIEAVPLAFGRYLIAYREVKNEPHLINKTATTYARAAESIQRSDYIGGVAVIIKQEAICWMAIGYARVVNLRSDMAPDSQPEAGETLVRVDRNQNPILGNPFVLKNKLDREARARVIAQYTEKLEIDFAENGPMLHAVKELAERVWNGERLCLQCWCAPLPCHADVLVVKINAMVRMAEAIESLP